MIARRGSILSESLSIPSYLAPSSIRPRSRSSSLKGRRELFRLANPLICSKRTMMNNSDIEVFPPFAALTQNISTHVTYLDTVGRPAVTFTYENLTDKHTGIIFVCSLPYSLYSITNGSRAGIIQGTVLGSLKEAKGCSYRIPGTVRLRVGRSSGRPPSHQDGIICNRIYCSRHARNGSSFELDTMIDICKVFIFSSSIKALLL